ncbi:MAG: pyridoxamine 5'-phosphate oxidase family protein [Elusimicrobiales bacterium]|nr:pyridoxamine 5'-phosphate oxidase family protein [Elusimicrobiales bacterium]
MTPIDYNALESEVAEILTKNAVCALATSSDDRVTVRSMVYVSTGLKVYFQTDMSFMKIAQIRKNPNVAICTENLQAEGTATLKGHPFEKGNENFAHLFKAKNSVSYKLYTANKTEIVIEVELHSVTLWKNEGARGLMEFLDIRRHCAQRQYYESEPVRA